MAKKLQILGTLEVEANPEEVQQIVRDYLVENPPEVTGAVKTVNGVAPDESGDVKAELSDEIKFALLDCLKNVAWAVENGMDFYNVLYNLLIKVYFTQTGETLTMYGIQLVSSIAQDGTELVLA